MLVRHLLDVMHIEKNVCESIYGTLLHQPRKTKDGVKARNDLIEMKIREKLVLGENDRSTVPATLFTMSKKEKMKFCQTLLETKVPEGYYSNFRNLVCTNNCRPQGLKSHDCHTLMQQLLSLAICDYLSKNVRKVVIRMCFHFNSLCSKVLDTKFLDKLEKRSFRHYVLV